jgi:uncharacterized protein with HEPN domain
MQVKTAKWLRDIVDACDFIVEVARPRTLRDYESNRVLRAAIERYLEIIGEALNRIRRNDPQIAARVPQVDSIIAFRNILIHGYDLVDHKRVWEVVQRDVPKLRDEITAILGEQTD